MVSDVKNTSTSSGLDQSIKVQTTDAQDTDSAGAQKVTRWTNPHWAKYNGYYTSHNSIRSVINKLGMWSVGKGYKADEATTKRLDKIVGWGKDTFNEVMNNQIRVMNINGDSYAHIITTDGELINEDGTNLLNLKPLNPGKMINEVDEQGILSGYKQSLANGEERGYEVEEIFHLTMNRTADEIHGRGAIEALTTFLDKIKQLDEDMSVMFHRYIVPLLIWKLNTDDDTAIAAFKVQEAAAWNKGDNLVTPEKAVEWDLVEAGKNGVDPMTWRNKWVEEVIKGGGVPALIMAIEAGTTEASSKMVYLAWQQPIEDSQLKMETNIKSQLHQTLKYEFPARIEENLGEDEGKDGDINTTKKSDVTITTKKVGDNNAKE